MAYRTPRTVSEFCSTVVPMVRRRTQGKRALDDIRAIVETDRWNSFDRFHDTTKTLVRRYREAGVSAEVDAFQTGGRIGTGRWIIQEAADVRSATVDILTPVRKRIVDFASNPWHVVQWSAATPPRGMVNPLVVVDDAQALKEMRPGALTGKMVLTGLNPRSYLSQFVDTCAAGLIVHSPVPHLPNATAWTKLGWGGIPIGNAACQLVCLALSDSRGKALRKLVEKHGTLTLRTKVDIRKYVGTHDVVSGVVEGADDSQDEVWVLSHSAEPGALDNASGCASCLEIARVLESLIADGSLRRPRRSIRFLNGYECYGFFKYLEDVKRFQTPLAGVVIDTIGSKPSVCNGRLEWHATIPMSAGFVDRLGERMLRAALRLNNPGYRLHLKPFQPTSDTLIGDPQYGFPCPWLTTHYRGPGEASLAYHTSADDLSQVSAAGMAACTAAMAGYLYYLADAGSSEVADLATWETEWTLKQIRDAGRKAAALARHQGELHGIALEKLKRWMWGGSRQEILEHLARCEARVREAAKAAGGGRSRSRRPRFSGGTDVPRRTAPLSPSLENTAAPLSGRIQRANLKPWALFWADGRRTLSQIAEAIGYETGSEATGEQVVDFFEAHEDLGYVDLIPRTERIPRSGLIEDLKGLGLERGMDVMVHSSLSAIGYVEGGADTVISALLSVIGAGGTLVMPSFNHGGAAVFNPLATRTTNGAIPDAFWRRPNAVRSLHPTHPVAAVGPGAKALCSGHIESGVWTADSPLGCFVRGGGFILSIGVGHEASTVTHVAEVSVPCGCIDPHGSTDRIVSEAGLVEKVPGVAFRSSPCPVSRDKLAPALKRRGLQKEGMVGHASSILVKALDLWKVRREHLRRVCPGCPIMPRRR
ncbi:MAG: AAC(3) family N-acetyltransferase [Candidatus Latescibacteria bacterium]|nr:AAC(3) family N-acetyltransferase [Candidatus Latescibacterota bacterium]